MITQPDLFASAAAAASVNKKETGQQKRWKADRTLDQFCGTETWYRFSAFAANWLLTDGTQYLAETYGAYWLMDAIVSHQSNPRLRSAGFQVWQLNVNEDQSAVLVCTDGDGKELVRQEIRYTDFPGTISLFAARDAQHWVILLPSEY